MLQGTLQFQKFMTDAGTISDPPPIFEFFFDQGGYPPPLFSKGSGGVPPSNFFGWPFFGWPSREFTDWLITYRFRPFPRCARPVLLRNFITPNTIRDYHNVFMIYDFARRLLFTQRLKSSSLSKVTRKCKRNKLALMVEITFVVVRILYNTSSWKKNLRSYDMILSCSWSQYL